jgi:putative transposase
VKCFRFIQAEKATYPVRMMCRLLSVSPAGFYAWCSRPPSARATQDAQLTRRIIQIHQESHKTYGSPRIHAELRLGHGIRVGKKRVARLMCTAGVRSIHRRRKVRTTRRDPEAAVAPDLVERDFAAPSPDALWVSDIKYVATWEGFLYLAATVDACTRSAVGWSMRSDLSTQLVLDALEIGLQRRRPGAGLVHHSDRGCQYTSFAFGRRCREAGVAPSVGSVGDAYDNAMAESFFATIEKELLAHRTFRSRDEARRAIFGYIEGFYNRRRRHSSIGYLSPEEFERMQRRATDAA